MKYVYLTKGQLLDFFGKAKITEKDEVIEASASDVLIQGDNLTVKVEKATNLFLYKEFSTLMDGDWISGKVDYAKFSSGVVHATGSVLNLPEKGAVINSKNRDYVMKVQ